jgi:ABC-type uncharacterized transport system involved in gliding motility auxiliary subunit
MSPTPLKFGLPPLSPTTMAVASLSLAAVLFVSTQIVSHHLLRGARADLTDRHLYSIAPATRAVLAGIREPITLRFYYSKRLGEELPGFGVFADRVRELLEEIAADSAGKVKLEVYDPRPFTPEEDRATAYGLQPVPVDQSGETVYFGLVGINTTDDEQVIPFFQPEQEPFLHYDLTKLIYALANPDKPTLGIIEGLPLAGGPNMQGQMDPPWFIHDEIESVFKVLPLGATTTAIDPKAVPALMVVHPQNLPAPTQYAIDQYVLAGGKALVMVDPFSEAQQEAMGGRGEDFSSNPKALLHAWGVEMDDGLLAGDARAARRVQVRGGNGQPMAADYLLWLQLREGAFAPNDPATQDLQLINMASAGVLHAVPGATTHFTPVLHTSAQSQKIAASEIKLFPDPAKLLRDFKPSGEQLTLAARLTGPAKTAFPDGPPKADGATAQAAPDTPAPERPAQLMESTRPIDVLVVADTDMLNDSAWVQVQNFFGKRRPVPVSSNANFVVSALENLAGAPDLSSLRGQGLSTRPFTVIEDLRRSAEAQYRETEQSLQKELQDAQGRLKELQSGKSAGNTGVAVLSADQRQELDRFESRVLEIRSQLRRVQLALREDIEALSGRLQFINIALVPLLAAVAALGLGLTRRNRRARRDGQVT